MAYVISFFLAIMPWLIIPLPTIANQTRAIKEASFDVACTGIIVAAFFFGIRTIYRNKWIAIFSAYVFMTAIWYNWYMPQLMSFDKKVYYNLWTINPCFHFIFAITATYLALSTLDEKAFKTIAKVLSISGIAVAVCMVMQSIGFDPFGRRVQYMAANHAVAILDNPDLSGGYLAMCLPFLMWRNKLIYWAGFVLCVVAIFLAGARSGTCLGFVGVMTYLLLSFRKNKKIFLPLLVFFLCVVTYCVTNQHINKMFVGGGFNGRWEIWKAAYKHIQENPLFGSGLGVWKTYQLILYQYLVLEVHSDWIERIVDIGFVGVSLMIAILVNSFKNFKYNPENKIGFAFMSSFVVFILMMTFGFPMEIGALAFTGLVTFWGVERL